MIGIGIGFRKRSGKDEVARYIQEAYGAERLAIADPLKLCLSALFPSTIGVPKDGLLRPPLLGMRVPYNGELLRTPREALLRIGDGLRSAFGPDFLAQSLTDRLCELTSGADPEYLRDFLVIVSDIRLVEEERALHKACKGAVLFLEIFREPDYSDAHPTENLVPLFPHLWTRVTNSGELEELYQKIDEAVGPWLSRYGITRKEDA